MVCFLSIPLVFSFCFFVCWLFLSVVCSCNSCLFLHPLSGLTSVGCSHIRLLLSHPSVGVQFGTRCLICRFVFADSGLAMPSNVLRQSTTNETELFPRAEKRMGGSFQSCLLQISFFLNKFATMWVFICGPIGWDRREQLSRKRLKFSAESIDLTFFERST